MLWIYNFLIAAYTTGIKIAAQWIPKAKLWVNGRKQLLQRIETALQTETNPIIWVHCASLGEFEQGRTVIEQLRQQYSTHKILLTFFSPSGYEIRKNYNQADYIFYLPVDTAANARQFIHTVRPALAIFVKYEYWHHFLHTLHTQNIPTLLVSGIFRPSQPFFKWYGGFWRRMLHTFTWFFVQDNTSLQLLGQLNLRSRATLAGDTRFDRVLEIATNNTPIPPAAAFTANNPTIVAGSTWDEDEKELTHYAKTHPAIRFIIAPHEVQTNNIQDVQRFFPNNILYTELEAQQSSINKQTLIINNIGLLSRLYQYATIAYIGGGFGNDGIHNALEAAVWGKPVVFGPVYDKYVEAIELIEAGGAFSVSNTLELEATLNRLLQNPDQQTQAGRNARQYVQQKAGATAIVLNYIQAKRLLTS